MVSFEEALTMICIMIERDRPKSVKKSRYLPTFRSFFIDVVCFKVDSGPVSLDSVSDVEWISKALSFS